MYLTNETVDTVYKDRQNGYCEIQMNGHIDRQTDK